MSRNVFFELNTGKTICKAVAIGPIIQGLNKKKPGNDLSRGCLVTGFANNVAIVAIQAQAKKGLI